MLILEIPGKLRKGIHIKDQLYPIDHHNYALQPSLTQEAAIGLKLTTLSERYPRAAAFA